MILPLQSFTAEPELVLLSWAEIDNVSVVVASLRRSDPSAFLHEGFRGEGMG
ncbi:hypothetical protein COMA1_11359 [Candidatus Nitrospira nitrosa]|uniref:Uncharacterized protein n=1 Tax=Candidatus Nitrospira nitrosa TaxID=1742972 RepID=A0A0S4LAH2_9BACT|nr:hypothetical protein COMA1_11359 [Candidatus Nitrospira nitrosa]